ncbi:hypothetical protein HEK616_09230 [Streptomyces nigrescens]|uniref:Uncharacterized protein n=2 Tax=Streptomyces TaxID=1883 RepID=A0ABN6QRX6_STRNI|nr:hypothetical protein [Streptomyces nigrescens]MEE4425139.1 hypothetical protein [Streptomyces sp. DSM 41528]BDM67436.1 hypothetical protein HEK616_09230 [Streptomyces nigrescens]
MPETDPPPESAPRIPATPEEALEIAGSRFKPRCHDGTPAALHVEEFDIGYLVYATFPPTEPRSFGGSHVVISKADGALTFVPNFPPKSAIALYRKRHHPNP